MNDVLRGVLFSLGGNIAISVGDHLKVYGDQQDTDGKKLYQKTSYQNRRRQCNKRVLFAIFGYLVMIFGQLCNGYALAFAPQTLLATIGSVQFIMNLVCSAVLMSRPIKTIHLVGTCGIILGCLVMIFGFSPKTDQSQLTVYALFYNFNSTAYRNYLGVVVAVFIASLAWQYVESTYIHAHSFIFDDHDTPKTVKHRNKRKATPRTDRNALLWKDKGKLSRLFSGFVYSFSSAMTGTQSVVLGKTMAITARNYMGGKFAIFQPLNLFVLMFLSIVLLSFLITFAFWLYRRTESMVLYDTVFIAPMNQVMWLTFSTVAGGIYFREFENAHTLQWVALIAGLSFNYVGLYYLVPTAADQPALVINMEKKQSKKWMDETLSPPSTNSGEVVPVVVDYSTQNKSSASVTQQQTQTQQKRKHIVVDHHQHMHHNNNKLVLVQCVAPMSSSSMQVNLAPTTDENEEEQALIGDVHLDSSHSSDSNSSNTSSSSAFQSSSSSDEWDGNDDANDQHEHAPLLPQSQSQPQATSISPSSSTRQSNKGHWFQLLV